MVLATPDKVACRALPAPRPTPAISPPRLQRRFPGVPITALTATATAQVREDILKLLGIKAARMFKVGAVLCCHVLLQKG